MASLQRVGTAVVVAMLVVSLAAFAYDAPLSDEAVREAYFLGRRHDETTAQFLETYRRYFAKPERGAHVFAVELFTPYARAVEAESKQAHLSVQQAERDEQLRNGPVRLGVYIRYTESYRSERVNGSSSYSDHREDFHVRLMQGGKAVDWVSSRYEGTFQSLGRGGAQSTGFIVWQEYASADVTASDATVEVETPDGQHVSAVFDLARLR
jgi:hypothetical protein